MKPSGVVCDAACGCPVPCPGGTACRCAGEGRREGMEHKTCSCGEHCRCNPCTCSKGASTVATGGPQCKCGSGCTCATCTA